MMQSSYYGRLFGWDIPDPFGHNNKKKKKKKKK
jgi:hypothetical protein